MISIVIVKHIDCEGAECGHCFHSYRSGEWCDLFKERLFFGRRCHACLKAEDAAKATQTEPASHA